MNVVFLLSKASYLLSQEGSFIKIPMNNIVNGPGAFFNLS